MSEEFVEIKTFRRLPDERIILDGIVWGSDAEKAIIIKDERTGNTLHSIKVNDNYYYPMAIVPDKK